MACDLGSPLKAEFNPCGNSFIGVSTTRNAFLMYDVRERKLVQSYVNLFEGAATSFSFHPSGDFAVCVSEEPKIKILDLIEGRPIFTLYGPRKALYATAFNPNGTLFATGGKDEELLIWKPVLIPYDCSGETEKENVSTASSAEEDTSASRASSNNKVSQTQEIVGSKSKAVSLDSLSRTSSAPSSSSVQST
jgi:WD40 repeat protein